MFPSYYVNKTISIVNIDNKPYKTISYNGTTKHLIEMLLENKIKTGTCFLDDKNRIRRFYFKDKQYHITNYTIYV